LSKAKRDFKFPADYDDKPLSQLLYREYNDKMLAQNAIDFDDILLYAYRILSERESIAKIYQRIYKHICIDEAQDLNRSQYEILKAIAGSTSSILMVGDPNQAIYGFNGSSPQFMTVKFPQEYNAAKYELLENYRSSKAVIEAAKKIESSFSIEGKLPIAGELSFAMFPNEEDEAKWVIEKILEITKDGHFDVEGEVTLMRCAIIARNKYVFAKLEESLKAQHIDYHVRASATQGLNSESTIFKVFDLSLRLLINPKDVLHLSEVKKILVDSSDSIRSFENLKGSALLSLVLGESASEVLETVWSILLANKSTLAMEKVLNAFEQYCNNENNFKSDEERLLVIKDYQSWREHWVTYCKATSVEERNLPHLMRSIALGITASSHEHGLTLSTVHMSKGLELDVIFVVGLN
jgi:DNA helicase-2/ATP-dependent DNA helicase PcrA